MPFVEIHTKRIFLLLLLGDLTQGPSDMRESQLKHVVEHPESCGALSEWLGLANPELPSSSLDPHEAPIHQ